MSNEQPTGLDVKPGAAEAYAAGSIVGAAEKVILPAAADMEIARDYLTQLQENSLIAVFESALGRRPSGWNPHPRHALNARNMFHRERNGDPSDTLQQPLKQICEIIEHACSKLDYPLRSGIASGLIWVPGIVPEQHAVMTTNASVIVVPAYLMLFCHRLTKLLFRSFPIREEGDRLAVTLDPRKVLKRIRMHRKVLRVWTRSLVFFATFDPPFFAPTIELASLPEDGRLVMGGQLLFSLEIFAIAHEYGHHIAQHRLGHAAESGAVNSASKEEELEADLLAALISRYYGARTSQPQDFFAMSGAGGVIILMAMELVRRTRCLLETGSETPFSSDTHPSIDDRLANFERIRTLCAKQDVESFENTRRHMRDLFEGLWRVVRPEISALRKKGVRSSAAQGQEQWLPR